MPYYCTVPRCTSMAGKAKNVSFHQFPRDEDLAKLWNKILKRGKPYTKYSKVCSLHFTPDDYTITSGQKNKGQWRTLRKDAIPSRNLPTDSPAPYQRRSSSWTPPPTMIDARMHQQMAQAIYVQTMLAMQAASISALNNEQSSSDEPEPTTSPYTPTTNTHTQNTNDTHTFKCGQCSKCFKDPDVFLLHQRSHTKNIENASTEEMLKANPILANLLNSNGPQTSIRQETGVFDVKNVKSIENQIMAALTANMENYLRNLSTIMTNNTVKSENFDNDQNSDNENYDNGQNFDNCQNSDNEGFDNGQNIDNKNFDKEYFNGQNFDNQNGQNSDNDHNVDNVDSKRDLMSNCDNQDLYDSNLVIDEDNS